MSLLAKIQKTISKVNGNTLTIEERKHDEFYCLECENNVTEDRFNHKHGVCYACFYAKAGA